MSCSKAKDCWKEMMLEQEAILVIHGMVVGVLVMSEKARRCKKQPGCWT